MAKVYLETSFISACVSTRQDAASVYRRDVSNHWFEREQRNYELVVSQEVHIELSHPRYPNRDAATTLIADVPVLSASEDVEGLARVLVNAKVMPGPAEAGDAIHVAFATVFECDYLLSWNVQHLANVNKARHLRAVCRRVGLVPPEIITPDLLRGD